MKTKLILLLLLSSSVLLLQSCDPCLNVNCVYGTCVAGDCECDPGYTGVNCEDPIPSSELVVFVTEDCGCGYITVNIAGGQSGEITGFYSSGNPSCGASGAANFTTNTGNILVDAYCNGINWSTTVNVVQGSCTKLQLNCDGTVGNNNTNTRYNCVSGNCVQASNGQYSNLSDCQNSCTSGGTSGYNCVSGNCTYVSSNAQYSSNNNCQQSCGGSGNHPCDLFGGGSTYYLVGNNCGTNAGHVSQTKCCPLSSPYWCPYTNLCYTTCEAAYADCENSISRVFQARASSNPPEPAQNGEVYLYVTSPITCGQLRVKVIDSSGDIDANVIISEPSDLIHCGAKKGVTYGLSPGNYTYQATCGSQMWNGSFVISAYQCKLVMIF